MSRPNNKPQRSNGNGQQRWVRRNHNGVGRRGSRQLTPVFVPAKR